MTTQPLSISLLSAPLAAIDRRALSQAWYSALHLAHDAKPQTALAGKRADAMPSRRTAAPSAEALRHERASTTILPARIARDDNRLAGVRVAGERRAAKSPLARRMERALVARRDGVERVTVAIGRRRGRVHVVVQTTHAGVRLIALCPPRVRDVVERALAQVRFALAARGIEVEACS
ncbi:MAG: hypothetical protein JO199_08690 [Candidatus Eremiobacteraeota bacterium]|nr:hypothetical protein [Candidatus Eremiobacteraeota bacterium]